MRKPTVFVSSTIKGMRETRSLVRKLLESELGYDVIVSENEGSRPITPVAQCRKWVKDCDIFIAILGGVYGWVIPRLGISVSEMEYNEACKDNPEKILVYVSAEDKDKRQREFVGRVEDFAHGYFRREPFRDEPELVAGIRCDLAEFMKDRLDAIRTKRIKVKERTSPVQSEYVTSPLTERVTRMYGDAQQVLEALGFSYAAGHELVKRLRGVLMYEKRVGRTNVLFSVWVLATNLDLRYLKSFSSAYQQYIRYSEPYTSYRDRFTIHIVHGVGTLRALESFFHQFNATCFKAEPGLYSGAAFDTTSKQRSSTYFDNMLFLLNVENKQSMIAKLSGAMNWLEQERARIDFRCNSDRLRKPSKRMRLTV